MGSAVGSAKRDFASTRRAGAPTADQVSAHTGAVGALMGRRQGA